MTTPTTRRKPAAKPDNLLRAVANLLAEHEARMRKEFVSETGFRNLMEAIAGTVGEAEDKLREDIRGLATASAELSRVSGRSAIQRADRLLEDIGSFSHDACVIRSEHASGNPITRHGSKSFASDLDKFFARNTNDWWREI